jgi:hypothetical protein
MDKAYFSIPLFLRKGGENKLTLSLPEGYCFIVHLFARGFSKKLNVIN